MSTLYDPPDIITEYLYYDEPILFTCRVGELVYLIDLEDEADHRQSWICVRLSPVRLGQVLSGAVDLYDAYRQAEDGYVILKTTFRNGDTQLHIQRCDLLTDDMLPLRGTTLTEGGAE